MSYVFRDETGKRWSKFRLLFLLALIFFFGGAVIFIRSLLVEPKLKPIGIVRNLSTQLKSIISKEQSSKLYSHVSPPNWLLKNRGDATIQREGKRVNASNDSSVRLGFYVQWDINSYNSLKEHAEYLTHVSSESFVISNMPPRLKFTRDSNFETLVQEFNSIEKNSLKVLPLLSNLSEDRWDAEAVEELLRSTQDQQNIFFGELISGLKEMEASGVIIDWEQLDPSYSKELTKALALLKRELMNENMELWLCIPVGNDVKIFDLDSLSSVVDRFVAMLYDETGDLDAAGPISSISWYKQWLSALIGHGNTQSWIVGLGSYGYDWKNNHKADTISFRDVMARASYTNTGLITNHDPFDGLHFDYKIHNERITETHTVWFLDVVNFRNQIVLADGLSVGGFAVWRLGLEDPAIWGILSCIRSCQYKRYEELRADDTITSVGLGDFLALSKTTGDGERRIVQDSNNMWSVDYLSYPRYPLIYHQGEENKHLVALTFDDGPDVEWTPQILDILQEKKVKATFFIIGTNATDNKSLLLRMVNEGHLLGNHTYSHGNLGYMSQRRIELELNATQLLIQSIVGRSTLLFRPPYNSDRNPQHIEEFMTLLAAQELGYLPVSASIDTQDWDNPTPEQILEKVKLDRKEGNVILMHDSGGDRTAMVQALPKVIDYLKGRGDEIVSLNELMGLESSSLMPTDMSEEALRVSGLKRISIVSTGFGVLLGFEELIWATMIVGTLTVLLRTLIILLLAVKHKNKEQISIERGHLDDSLLPPVSVLIAAYNEDKVIASTLEALCASRYTSELEIIVIDDGSRDNTASIVADCVKKDKRIRLVSQANSGKASALNSALRVSRFEHVVMLDADTQFEPETIFELIRNLSDDKVGAVSGYVKVGNTKKWLGKFQSLEYMCGFNLDRRAYDVWNCITVVPGAVSAFKRSAIEKAGGILDETLAEDTDLTLHLHKCGYKIVYAHKAIAWTEAPESIYTLLQQRKRWAFGTLQCLWKHIDLLFNLQHPSLGFFSIPSAWFCHILLVALIPLVDILLIFSLLTGQGFLIFEYALVFLFVDLFIAAGACVIDGSSLKNSWLILPMRLIYRPILALAVWSAVVRALRGAWVGWGKLERKGSVLGEERVR